MRLAVLSDVHVHREDHATDVAALAEKVRRLDVNLILCGGDLSHRSAELEGFLRAISRPAPVRCAWVPGNHDIWVIDKESAEDTAPHRYRRTN
jgi:3',5'-cyclic AMP phosphodiesterase CpdA